MTWSYYFDGRIIDPLADQQDYEADAEAIRSHPGIYTILLDIDNIVLVWSEGPKIGVYVRSDLATLR